MEEKNGKRGYLAKIDIYGKTAESIVTNTDIAALLLLLVFAVMISSPEALMDQACEVARPDYECITKQALYESCGHLQKENPNNATDLQIRWYMENLCETENKLHDTGLNCKDMTELCNALAERKIGDFVTFV